MSRKLGAIVGLLVLIAALAAAILIGRGNTPEVGPIEPGEQPTIEASTEDPPDELVIKDLKEGDGAEAKEGDTLSVFYEGAIYKTGKVFDSAWDKGEAFDLTLGAGGVIAGWDQGLEGMKVGGRRELIIPPDLGYGAQGSPPSIPPNSTLVFIIDLVGVNSSPSTGATTPTTAVPTTTP